MDISYRQIYAMNKEEARKQIVNSYLAIGNISQVARLWHTSRNVVRKWVKRFEDSRNGFKGKRKPRKVFYPAHLVWELEKAFSLAQVDTKDILDKEALGTILWTHILRKRLPRYQWTFCEGKNRLRFLAYSRELSLVNGICFTFLVMLWLKRHGIDSEVVWQTGEKNLAAVTLTSIMNRNFWKRQQVGNIFITW